MCIRDSVYTFWFGDVPDVIARSTTAAVAERQRERWFGKADETDARIRRCFGAFLDETSLKVLNAWRVTPRGALCAVLVLDQFSRNVYRDTAKAFRWDAVALEWCREGLEGAIDAVLEPIERVFFYLPLEHSEAHADQIESVRRFTALRDEAAGADRETLENMLSFAIAHERVISRFGRYPHRNAALGRVSTAQERAFLTEPGSSF